MNDSYWQAIANTGSMRTQPPTSAKRHRDEPPVRWINVQEVLRPDGSTSIIVDGTEFVGVTESEAIAILKRALELRAKASGSTRTTFRRSNG